MCVFTFSKVQNILKHEGGKKFLNWLIARAETSHHLSVAGRANPARYLDAQSAVGLADFQPYFISQLAEKHEQ